MNYKSCKRIFDRGVKWYVQTSKEASHQRMYGKGLSSTDLKMLKSIPFVSLFGGYCFAKHEKCDVHFDFVIGSVFSVVPASIIAATWCYPGAVIFMGGTAFLLKVIPYII